VSNSGPMHLAAALGKPGVALGRPHRSCHARALTGLAPVNCRAASRLPSKILASIYPPSVLPSAWEVLRGVDAQKLDLQNA